MRDMRLVVLAIFAPSVALAAPEVTLEMIDRGDAVEVVAHNVKATHTTVNPVRSRLEVSLAGYPMAKPAQPTDATVKVIELDGGEVRSLSVKLNYERSDVKALARFAQAIQVGDDVHLMFPRKLPAEGETVKLPDPTLPPALAATLVKPEPKPVAKPVAKPEPKPEPKPEAAVAKAEAPKPEPVPTKKAQIPTVTDDDASSKLAMYAALGLGAVGVGLWIMKKKKTAQVATASIDVVAQRSLGGKTKIVWLTAGAREMLVAVTPQNVRMLGQWDKGDAPHADEPAFAPAIPRTTTSRMSTQMTAVTSPAVDGILKLRRQTGAFTVPAVNDEVATDDVEADSAWAREMFAATGGRR
jgi:flagellar biogenesis protein FliO